ncbi:MAG TPA: hypothetical protein DEO82_03940 [Eubacterium sp.]|nr:hypothetical protein [Eubacterium sp.]
MTELFDIVGEDFFRPLTSLLKTIYVDCLNIIYESYRTELSYGADRDVLVAKLADYFESIATVDIQFEDETESLKDSKSKASTFLRKLKEYGWVEYDIGNDQKIRVIMPNYSVSMIQTLGSITSRKEMEYQSEISAIYSLLTNEELLSRPYVQVVKPVYDHTLALFTELKKLNTSIRKYIEEITSDKSAEEILDNFFTYHEEVGSKAYHRIKTNDNVSRFRNTIIRRLQDMLEDRERFELIVQGYMNIEGANDHDDATESVHGLIAETIDRFKSYDDIVDEIDRRHSKYIRNAVERAKFLLLNSNNAEGKISKILQYMACQFNRDEENNLTEDATDDICRIFSIFPQGFLSGESLKAIPISKKITDVDELAEGFVLTDEEREFRRLAIIEKNKNRFSKKNISAYVEELLEKKPTVRASEIEVASRRDMIRIIFIYLYGKEDKTGYMANNLEEVIEKEGFRFRDFEIKRRIR